MVQFVLALLLSSVLCVITNSVGNADEKDLSKSDDWYAHMVKGKDALQKADWQTSEREFNSARELANSLEENYQVWDQLGTLYQTMGKLNDAKSAHLKSLDFAKEGHGDTSYQVGIELHNIANVDLRTGHPDLAERQFEQAAKIFEKTNQLGFWADSINALGTIYYSRGELEKAERSFSQSISLHEKVNGKVNLVSLPILNNLANVLQLKGQTEEAKAIYLKVLTQQEREYGLSHPEVASTLGYLANVLTELGEMDQAGSLYKRVVKIDEEFYGAEHQETAEGLWELAEFHRSNEDYQNAAEAFERVIRTYDKLQLSNDHRNAVASYFYCLRDQGKSIDEIEKVLAGLQVDQALVQEIAADED